MFYQVEFSPGPSKKLQKKPEETVPEEIAILSLAPFTHNPKLSFEDVKPGKTAKRKLQIQNPTRDDIELYITKGPPDERGVYYTWVQEVIPAEDSSILEITWNPTECGAWRDMLTFEDGNRIKRDVPVVFKCVSPKKPARNKIKPISAKLKPLENNGKKRSPTKKPSPAKLPKWRTSPGKSSPKIFKKRAKENRPPLQENTAPRIPQIIVDSPKPRRETFLVSNIENCLPLSNIPIIPSVNSTYTIALPKQQELADNKKSDSDNFEDSLELSPTNMQEIPTPLQSSRNCTNITSSFTSSKFQSIAFTPILNNFEPSVCSTGEKSQDYINIILAGISPSNENMLNISAGTYIKDKMNITGETYVKANLSGGTYVKGNVSASTYVLDDSIGNLGSISDYPAAFPEKPKTSQVDSAKDIIDANLWTNEKKRVLERITEESIDHTPRRKSMPRKRKSDLMLCASPPKKVGGFSKKKVTAIKRTKVSSGLDLKGFIAKSRELQQKTKSVVLHDPDSFLSNVHNPYLFSSTNDVDPFISATLYYEPRWLDEQEMRFTRWLNILLSPPEALRSNAESHPVDIAKLWQECKKRLVDKSVTKEEMSSKLHVRGSLDRLRTSAVNLFRTQKVAQTLSKATMLVENSKLTIRNDKNVHVDLGLQYEIMKLFLSYNPLWLRIGLETIFGKTVKLNSNSDLMGISVFIMRNFFKDSYLLTKHKTVHSDKYALEIKKHILKKFLMLVYFLDCAKDVRLIKYDPCLFCKNAPYKESRELVHKFASILLSAVGDITKCLRLIGYALTHKQTYIHEFDYAIENLGADIRDGVRLTKVMEIILLRDDLVPLLRVPSISRLQKIHNVKLVFESLREAEYNIQHDITPKDIVDGHREKTLSFLWQIIYKFQAPMFKKAVVTVQGWWKSLRIVIKRKILNREHKRRNDAALVIQQRYRALKEMQNRRLAFVILRKTVVSLQTHFRGKLLMLKHRRDFIRKRQVVILIQNRYRAKRAMIDVRNTFLQQKKAAIIIQTHFRAWRLGKKQRDAYLRFKDAVLKIQEFFRAIMLRNIARSRFIEIKEAVVCMQRMHRANVMMKNCRLNYENLKRATVVIQRWVRARLRMREERTKYVTLKNAAVVIQNNIRSYLTMREVRAEYLLRRNSAIVIQRHFRAYKLMLFYRKIYLVYKQAVVKVQELYRARVAMKKQRATYLQLKQTVLLIETRFIEKKSMVLARSNFIQLRESTICIQRRYRANRQMLIDRNAYETLKKSTVFIQRKHRATMQMRSTRDSFTNLKKAAVRIQTRFRAQKEMQVQRNAYLRNRDAAMIIQNQFRAWKQMQEQRFVYLKTRDATILIQNRFRAWKQMQQQRAAYLKKRDAAVLIQTQFRAWKQMQLQRMAYLQKRNAIIKIQNQFRAWKQMQEQRKLYLQYRQTVVKMQQLHRANILMQHQRASYQHLKKVVLFVENKYTATKTMIQVRNYYLKLGQATITIQRQYRANLQMHKYHLAYINLKKAAIVIQTRYRAKISMQQTRVAYLRKRDAIIVIQTRFKALKLMQKERKTYLKYRNTVVQLQQLHRANVLMKQQRASYLLLKKTVTFIENKYIATKLMIELRCKYIQLQKATISIQRKYRANVQMHKQLTTYTDLRKASVVIQNRFRAQKSMRKARADYLRKRDATIVIQTRFRALKQMQQQQKAYLHCKNTVLKVQRLYRANNLMKKERASFVLLKKTVLFVEHLYIAKKIRCEFVNLTKTAITLQQKFRAKKLMQIQCDHYRRLIKATLVIQARYKALKASQKQRQCFIKLRNATVSIQRRFRANRLMKEQCRAFNECKTAATFLQRKFRAHLAMKIARQAFVRKLRAIVLIQIRFKAQLSMVRQRMWYHSITNLVVRIQRRFRARKLALTVRNDFVAMKKSAVIIQGWYRGICLMRHSLENYVKVRTAVVKIQRYFRGYLELKKQMRIRKIKLSTVVKVQTYGRGVLARKRAVELRDPELVKQRKLMVQRKNSAIKIQAYWRGFKSRKLEPKQMKEIRKRYQVAARNNNTEKTLGYRKGEALKILVSENSTFLQIIRALEDIEYVTRRCKDTCLNLSNKLASDVANLIKSSGRSLPDLNACVAGANILINFCKYPPSSSNAWAPEQIEGIILTMVHWSDKEYLLFPYLCTLIWLFTHNKKYLRYLQNLPNIRHQMMKMKTLCERKQKMTAKASLKNASVFAPYKNLPLPSLIPDWGLEFKHRPRAFTNSMHALKCLLAALKIE